MDHEPDIDELCQVEKRLHAKVNLLKFLQIGKVHLDMQARDVVKKNQGCEGVYPEIKSLASTRRKATTFFRGDVRKVTDMARVSVICNTPEDLEKAYLDFKSRVEERDLIRVSNGFSSGWMPGGYRDVKLNPVVEGHLCEIQLHLRSFYELKPGAHKVYEWARDLKVTTEMQPEHLFENMSRESAEEMIRLAERDWRGTEFCLPDLLAIVAQFAQAEALERKTLCRTEHELRGIEDHQSNQWRNLKRAEAVTRNSIGSYLEQQGKYEEAAPWYLEALAIDEEVLGQKHPEVATYLTNTAELLRKQGKYAEAGPLHERAIAIWEETLGPEHPQVATGLNNRAGLLESLAKYDEAGSLFERARAINEEVLGKEHPEVAACLGNIAGLLESLGKYKEAAPLYQLALEIDEGALGPEHPKVATDLNNVAHLLTSQGNYDEAGPLYQRALAIDEKVLGPEHPEVATDLNNLGDLWSAQGMYDKADPLYIGAIDILEKAFGPEHPDVAFGLNNRGAMLEQQGQQGNYEEARSLYQRAHAINEKVLGPEHPEVATDLNNLAVLLEAQARADDGSLLEVQEKYIEAKRLYERSQAIREKALGPDHPDVATSLNNQAEGLEQQDKYEDADRLYTRALEILGAAVGEEHPNYVATLESRADLRARTRTNGRRAGRRAGIVPRSLCGCWR